MANEFFPRKFEDFYIIDDDNKTVGQIRVKPSGILWAPPRSRYWFRVDLQTFGEFMVQNGTKQIK
jgi:hypothetical protein